MSNALLHTPVSVCVCLMALKTSCDNHHYYHPLRVLVRTLSLSHWPQNGATLGAICSGCARAHGAWRRECVCLCACV